MITLSQSEANPGTLSRASPHKDSDNHHLQPSQYHKPGLNTPECAGAKVVDMKPCYQKCSQTPTLIVLVWWRWYHTQDNTQHVASSKLCQFIKLEVLRFQLSTELTFSLFRCESICRIAHVSESMGDQLSKVHQFIVWNKKKCFENNPVTLSSKEFQNVFKRILKFFQKDFTMFWIDLFKF